MQQIIEKLQCVDDCLELADIAPESQVRELLAEVIADMQRLLQQTHVSGRSEQLPARNRYIAGKVVEHINSVGYSLSSDIEKLVAQVLEVDGSYFDEQAMLVQH